MVIKLSNKKIYTYLSSVYYLLQQKMSGQMLKIKQIFYTNVKKYQLNHQDTVE